MQDPFERGGLGGGAVAGVGADEVEAVALRQSGEEPFGFELARGARERRPPPAGLRVEPGGGVDAAAGGVEVDQDDALAVAGGGGGAGECERGGAGAAVSGHDGRHRRVRGVAGGAGEAVEEPFGGFGDGDDVVGLEFDGEGPQHGRAGGVGADPRQRGAQDEVAPFGQTVREAVGGGVGADDDQRGSPPAGLGVAGASDSVERVAGRGGEGRDRFGQAVVSGDEQ